jgi:hypothetical protein
MGLKNVWIGRGVLVTLLVGICSFEVSVRGQQPFVTDDTDVVEKGKVELEVLDEFDRLHHFEFPETYQNGMHAEITYGLLKDVEISVEGEHLGIASVERPRMIGGISDISLEAKYNFRHDKEHSYLPAMAIAFFVQVPTGNVVRGLSNGVTNVGINSSFQKTLGEKNTLRVNGGYLFAGNTIIGQLGILSIRGHIFSGSASYVRKINEKLQLGGEFSGAVTSRFELNEGQQQVRFGGNYQISKKTSLDFGLTAGKYSASPRWGIVFGFTREFGRSSKVKAEVDDH